MVSSLCRELAGVCFFTDRTSDSILRRNVALTLIDVRTFQVLYLMILVRSLTYCTHSDYLVLTRQTSMSRTDLMIEAKDKEQAVFHLFRRYGLHPIFHGTSPLSIWTARSKLTSF